ncbi:MAG: hypothetical protein M1820_009249 [Bogoriella megaspora]|nr:MAG: hypothetical protein M1820_009249 [Bogoriella megaspora]
MTPSNPKPADNENDANNATEQTGLLPETGYIRDLPQKRKKPVNHNTVALMLVLATIILGAGDLLTQSPQTRIFEAIICRRYFKKHDPSVIGQNDWVPERLCKIEPVESGVALLIGWQSFFDSIPSLILAVPYGWIADRYGRKPVIVMALISFWWKAALTMVICFFGRTIPIQLVWATSVVLIFGGGPGVTIAVAYTMLSDIIPEAERSTMFLRLGSATMITSFIAPPVSAVLMKRSVWIPMLLGLALQLIPIPLSLAIPETLHLRKSDDSIDNDALEENPPLPSPVAAETMRIQETIFRNILSPVKDSVGFIFEDSRLLPLISTFFTHMLLMSGTQLMTLYVSKRYHWSISNATFLASVRAGVNIIVFLALLPALSALLIRRCGFTGLQKDLWLTRISCILVVVGYAFFGLAPSISWAVLAMTIFTFGNGHSYLMRSFISSLVHQDVLARLFMVISMVDTLGMMAGGPLLAGLFQEGLQLGGLWVGLPYYFIALLFVLVTVLLFIVSIRASDEKGEHSPVPQEDSTEASDGEVER